MKNFIVGCAIAFASVRYVLAAELVETCSLADGAANVVEVTKDHPIADTEVYQLHYAGKTEYFFDDEERSRGGPVKVVCVTGKKQRALVTYGEFTSNYNQGFLLIYNRLSHKIERLDFAEKGLPEWLYLGEKEVIVIVSTNGVGDNGAAPYVAYRLIKEKIEQPALESVDVPAPPAGYDVIKLKQ